MVLPWHNLFSPRQTQILRLQQPFHQYSIVQEFLAELKEIEDQNICQSKNVLPNSKVQLI